VVGFVAEDAAPVAGIRVEPEPSLPVASGTTPAATAAAEPAEAPQGEVPAPGVAGRAAVGVAPGLCAGPRRFEVVPIGVAPGGPQPLGSPARARLTAWPVSRVARELKRSTTASGS
jgi:hypothetical protein